MKILILGSGGREYAIALALSKDTRINKIFLSPGNGATAQKWENVNFSNNDEMLAFCKSQNIALVVIGPEDPLVNGIADILRSHKIKVFGPSKNAARLEGSKAFMKDFAARAGIRTAKYIKTQNLDEIKAFLQNLTPPFVLKADGLCAGKGVLILDSVEAALQEAQKMLNGSAFGAAGQTIVVEEYLNGYELSVFAITDGQDCVVLPAAQDHKRLLDSDKGPNTGGMGAYAPTAMCDEKLLERIKSEIMQKAIDGMRNEGNEFCGVLFGGIMVVEKNGEKIPYLLEFNVRFGDPECEILLPILKTPLLDILLAVANKNLQNLNVQISSQVAVGVVAASKNYPFKSSEKAKISISDFDQNLGHIVFAGVSLENGELYASGGRVLLAVGLADDLQNAQKNAYKILESIKFDGMQYRKDIALKGLNFLDSVKG